MFKFLFKKHVHEPIAAAAMGSAGVIFHFAWISNLLVNRSSEISQFFTISETIGPMSGMLFADLIIFLVVFGLLTFAWKGKDCSERKNTIYWFFVTAIIAFFVMTLPVVYELGVGIV